MIPNDQPCHHVLTGRDVVAWSDDGEALVLDAKVGRLVPVYGPLAVDNRVVQMIPATGWQVTHNHGTEDEFTEPLVAWGLRSDGSVVPLNTDCGGLVEDLDGYRNFRISSVPTERQENA
ncbi:hypothetical protein CBI38_24660 [Rhodococcus oxybenzonivorans]|uniref:Uncharacterized protein n=1 Tax=Rhodococcus oxybenzonivorans TaxID=1990687 RepID=A0A2S2C081_9NOCA|nr:hypothetical protein [Rhodococcus oxybenzonivorans]AWK74270.1 hypothetical protein CBI38_24660 [Rhodococcus oxybenzonivorans]